MSLDASVTYAIVTEEDIVTAKKMLISTIKLDNYCSSTSDCSTAPIGPRSCDSANGLIVYSKMSVYADDIQKLALLISKLEEQYNRENLVQIKCSVVGEPAPVCVDNKCKRTSTLHGIIYPFGRY